MNDATGHRQLVEQICSYLAGTDRRWSDGLAEAAAAYSTLCREANERLRRCTEFLERGLRSEAVHLAECIPALPEFLPALDTSQFEQWAAACIAAGVPPPPALRAEGLEELQAARERERQLQPLVSRHRTLAVMGAPLSERLNATQTLRELDPDNPCWPQGVRDLEIARLGEIREQVRLARDQDDEPAINAIAAELSERPWLAPIPAEIRADLDAALSKFRTAAASKKMTSLLFQILTTYKSRSYYECAALMSNLQSLIETSGVELPPDVERQMRPVLEWLSAKARRNDVSEQLKATESSLNDQRKRLRRTRIKERVVRVGVAMGVLSIVAVAVFLLLRSLN